MGEPYLKGQIQCCPSHVLVLLGSLVQLHGCLLSFCVLTGACIRLKQRHEHLLVDARLFRLSSNRDPELITLMAPMLVIIVVRIVPGVRLRRFRKVMQWCALHAKITNTRRCSIPFRGAMRICTASPSKRTGVNRAVQYGKRAQNRIIRGSCGSNLPRQTHRLFPASQTLQRYCKQG